MTGRIDITGLSPSRVLAALYNGTVARGMGVLDDLRRDMTEEEALAELARNTRVVRNRWDFDYVRGRPIKVSIVDLASGPSFESSRMVIERADRYDRDAPGGSGSCARVIAALRERDALARERAR